MSWPFRIIVVYAGFVGLIATLVFISSSNKSELVAKDYYSQELNYQERLNEISNANALTASVSYLIDEHYIHLSMPLELLKDKFKGDIQFYCPSDSEKDTKMIMHFDENGKQSISKDKLKKGTYKMNLSWESGGRRFYKECVISVK